MWYGWIPILGNRVIVPDAEERFLDSGNQFYCIQGTGLELHRADARETAILDHANTLTDAQLIAADWVCERKLPLDDKNLNELTKTLVFCEQRRQGRFRIKNIVFLNDNTEPDECIDSFAKVHNIDYENGMVTFEPFVTDEENGRLSEDSEEIEQYAKCHYKVIRNLYHRHVYTHSDFGVMPVEANGLADAVKSIWEGHFGQRVFVERHRHISSTIEATAGHPRDESWRDIISYCAKAQGEALYAKSMAELLKMGSEYVDAAERAITSFANLSELASKQLETVVADTSFVANEKMVAANNRMVFLSYFVCVLGVVGILDIIRCTLIAYRTEVLANDDSSIISLILLFTYGFLVYIFGLWVWANKRRLLR